MNFSSILVWFASYIGIKIVVSLGMGFISFGAVLIAANYLLDLFSDIWEGIPSDILNILSLAGFHIAIGWIIGAWLARLSLTVLSKLGKMPDENTHD